MILPSYSFSKLTSIAAALLMVVGFAALVSGQEPQVKTVGLPDDWSHHHLIFSNPGTAAEALAQGRFEQWLKITNDPRYQLQQLKRSLIQRAVAAAPDFEARTAMLKATSENVEVGSRKPRPSSGEAVQKDWSEPLDITTFGTAVQPNTLPAKYGASLTTASCSGDFVVYPTGKAGSATAATIVAYNNLYTTGCSGTVPSVYWAYNTGAYAVSTSPILSIDGTRVAFIQTTAAAAELVVLKWAASTTETVSAPGTPTTASNLQQCTAPCMTVIALTHADTYSQPYYDYASDALYVGDNNSNLEKFTGVFYGTTIAGPTLASLNATTYDITSPVYDPDSGRVFVGDTEGYLYSVSSGVAGTVCTGSYGLFGRSELLGAGNIRWDIRRPSGGPRGREGVCLRHG